MAEWRSSALTLAAIGAAGVAGCGPCEDYLQNGYASLDDCGRDYSQDSCESVTIEKKLYNLGPWYLKDRSKVKADDPEPDPGAGASGEGHASTIATNVYIDSRRKGFGFFGPAGTSSCS